MRRFHLYARITDSFRPARNLWRDYFELTNPRMVAVTGLSGFTAMVIAGYGTPDMQILGLTMIGGTLTAAGAFAYNNAIDVDIDRKMSHTRWRPVPTQRIHPQTAQVFGIILMLIGSAIFGASGVILPAVLALGAVVFYLAVYSRGKRHSVHHIHLGAAICAVPSLAGWAAINGRLSVDAFILSAILFYWTTLSFLTRALVYSKEFLIAGLPTPSFVFGEQQAREEIFRHSLLLAILGLFPVVTGMLNAVYGVAAVLLGAFLVFTTLRLKLTSLTKAKAGNLASWNLYRYLNLYIGLLLMSMIIDCFIYFL